MKCPKCQAENPDDTLFCGKCGTKFDTEEVAERPGVHSLLELPGSLCRESGALPIRCV